MLEGAVQAEVTGVMSDMPYVDMIVTVCHNSVTSYKKSKIISRCTHMKLVKILAKPMINTALEHAHEAVKKKINSCTNENLKIPSYWGLPG